jgi:hypothetical protein
MSQGQLHDAAPVGNADAEPVHDVSVATASPGTVIDEFIAAFKVPLPVPVLTSTPILRKTREVSYDEDDDDWVPKRSARLAAKSRFREDKPEAQARKVLMKKLGLEVETQ